MSTPAATAKQTRKQLKAAIKAKSYSDRIAWWMEQSREGTLPQAECEAEVRSIEKRLAKILNEVPSQTWHEDVRKIAPAVGGLWPCPGMIRAKGERRLYPPSYITTSGHSFDVYLQHAHAGGIQHLLPEDPDKPSEATPERDCTKDGYLGSVVTIYQLQDRDQRRIRSREQAIQGRGKYRTMTGIL
jgi:hypothetical protein